MSSEIRIGLKQDISRPMAQAIVVIAYVVACAVCAWLMLVTHESLTLYGAVLVAMVAATTVIFAFGIIFNNSSLFDAYWSVIPPLVAIVLIPITASPVNGRVWLLLGLIMIWAIRLTYNWWRRWRGLRDEDWRYINLRKQAPINFWIVHFFGVYHVPNIFIYGGMLPVIYAIANNNNPLNGWDVLAVIITGAAIALETIADEQLVQFINVRQSSREILATGVWKYCRHPNYLGEIGFWFGLFFFALGANGLGGAWTLIGSVAMLGLFWFISVPLITRRYLERRDNYAEHIKNVPALFPRFW